MDPTKSYPIYYSVKHFREDIKKLDNKLQRLFKKLDDDDDSCSDFIDNVQADIHKMKENVFAVMLQAELDEWWFKCHCPSKEVSKLPDYCYEQNLFENHRKGVKLWHLYYKKNKEMFVLLQEYKRWLKLKIGYKNMNEVTANKLTTRMLQIEKRLLELSEAFFERKETHFQTFGKTIQEVIYH